MSRSHRGRQTQRRAGQYHGRAARLLSERLLRVVGVLALLCAPAAAQSLLHINVVEGEGAIHAAGTKSSRGIVVQVTDETGRPVDGSAVSFRMPEEGPGATFPRGMRTEIAITTPDGRAAIHEYQCGMSPGPFQVRVTAIKGEVRAGTVVSQYVSEHGPAVRSARSNRRKWLTVGALVAAGAVGGIVAAGGRGASNPAASASAPPPQIGTPTISIGNP